VLEVLYKVIFESVLVGRLQGKADVLGKPDVHTKTPVYSTGTDFIHPGVTTADFDKWINNRIT